MNLANPALAAAPAAGKLGPEAAVATPAEPLAAPPADASAADTPVTGFQQALQQARASAMDLQKTPATPEDPDLARWLDGAGLPAVAAAPGEPAAAASSDSDTPADPTSPQDSPALQPDWTLMPTVLGAGLGTPPSTGGDTPTAALAATQTATPAAAPSHGKADRPAMPGEDPRFARAAAATRAMGLDSPSHPTTAAPDTTAAALPSAPASAAHVAAVQAPVADTGADGASGGTAADATLPGPGLGLSTPPQGGTGSMVSTATAADATGPLRTHSPQALREALGERLSWQVDQRSEQATIRLSPERLGHIDIQIRHEAGGLQVQLAASHGEVLRQLQQVSDGLRQDLGQRHGGEISVQVAERRDNAGLGEGGSRQQQGRSPEEQRPGRALAEADADDAGRFALA